MKGFKLPWTKNAQPAASPTLPTPVSTSADAPYWVQRGFPTREAYFDASAKAMAENLNRNVSAEQNQG